MTDQDLDRLLASSAVADRDLEGLDLHAGERDLLEEIMSTPVLDHPDRRTDEAARSPRRHRRLVPSLAAAAAVAAVATMSVWAPWNDQPDARPDGSGSVATAPEVSSANPLLLLDDPAWRVMRVDEQAEDYGEMTFSDGDRMLDVLWKPAGQHDLYFEDRAEPGNTKHPIELLGLEGTMFRYGDSTDFTTILPPDGPSFLEIRGDLGSRSAYVDLVRGLERVDPDTWAAAMPSTVVDPSSTDATVAEMLKDVPLPQGFDASVLDTGLFADRYQVGAEVAGAVACAWLDQWDDARRTGDAAAAQQAVTAMRSSRDWEVLHRMNEQGDYPEAVWETSRAMVGRAQTPSAKEMRMGAWVQGLGCDSPPRSLNMD